MTGITTARGERAGKTCWHGRMRAHERAARAAIVAGAEDHAYPGVRDVSNPWSFGKDGKRRGRPGEVDPRHLRE